MSLILKFPYIGRLNGILYSDIDNESRTFVNIVILPKKKKLYRLTHSIDDKWPDLPTTVTIKKFIKSKILLTNCLLNS